MRVPFALALIAFIPFGCGSDEPEDRTGATVTSAIVPAATTSVDPVSTTTSRDIDVELRDGEVSGPDMFVVDVGDTVDLWVVSDVDDEVHVHGYDLSYALEAGEPVNLSFLADVSGIFEVDVHTGHTVLLESRVSG